MKILSQTWFKVLKLIILVYLFMTSIVLMGHALKSFDFDLAAFMLEATANPFTALFIGILSTSIIQSSSTTTSIVVGLVGANIIDIPHAVPIIMGANVGTSITNTIVSMAHIRNAVEFRRAFAASTIHDFFNLLAVITLLPLQIYFNFIGGAALWAGELFESAGGLTLMNPLKAAVGPFVHGIDRLLGRNAPFMLICALLLLVLALTNIVHTLKSLVLSRIETFFDKYIFRTVLRAYFFGLILTALVQSSSISTSLIVPMAGAGILTLEKIFPFTLGANMGTTLTAMLAALATNNLNAISVAIAHALFNGLGTAVWLPLKRIPILLARHFAEAAVKNRLLPVIYIALIFFIIPLTLVYLS